MHDSKTDYFEYLENVLGIKSILQDSIPAQEKPIPIDLLFCVHNYKTYSAEEIDLLQKMIAAVKVEPSRLKVCDLMEANKFETKALVIFEDEVVQTLILAQVSVQTFSPRVLLKKPELKKQAWTELQKILQFFA